MKQIFFSLAIIGFLASCNTPPDSGSADSLEVTLEFLDSIVVESLSELYLASKNEQTGNLIFKERFLKEFLVTNSTGEILSKPDLKGEGPNQVSFPMEIGFMEDQLVVKEISAEMKLNFFDSQFNKIKMSPALAQGLNMVEISVTRQSFSVIKEGSSSIILGVENNAVEPEWMSSENQTPEFYNNAKTGYLYNLDTDSLNRINLFPDNWQPKKDKIWVGQSLPFITALKNDSVIAVLPRIGNQVFFYQLKGGILEPLGEFLVSHPERNIDLKVDPMEQPFLYPAFSDIKGGGKYFLIEFFTEIPLEIYQELRAKSENYMQEPEFKDAMKKYRKAKYLLLNSQGEQAVLAQLPIEGQIHYIDANDVIYIKPETKEEKDYNVFYRYQVKM